MSEPRVLVVVGPGGVGKTTVSAALGLRAAKAGQDALVLTVDPARRLAQALGLEDTEGRKVRVSPRAFAEAEMPLGTGALYALMLDARSTWDTLVKTHAPDLQTARRIMNSPFYEQASRNMVGSLDYMAVEKLYELDTDGNHELIVVDTPPASNALDFLSAPERMTELVDGRSLKLLIGGLRAAGGSRGPLMRFQRMVLKVMGRFVGAQLFMDLLDFIESFSSLFRGFERRAKHVRKLLRSSRVGFVVVCSPEPASLEEGLRLVSELNSRGMGVEGFLVNQALERSLLTGGDTNVDEALRDLPIADEAREHLNKASELFRKALLRQEEALDQLKLRNADGQLKTGLLARRAEGIDELRGLGLFAEDVTGALL